jgi:hypothetical protein
MTLRKRRPQGCLRAKATRHVVSIGAAGARSRKERPLHPNDPSQPAQLSRLASLPPVRFVRRVIRSPEYGVLYMGIAFWLVAGTLGIGRPLFDIVAAHV